MRRLENDLEKFLNELCIDWGFCLPSDKRRRIADRKDWDAREFALEILRTEGFDHPEYEIEWVRRLSARFKKRFGK
jgi:hypothetical protein